MTINDNCISHGVYDYHAILKNQSHLRITSNKDLALYVRNILRWKDFVVKQTEPAQQNIWRVRLFLQTMTGTGISILEGAHRLTLAAKLLTGMAINKTIPY
jgi:hypothetical protein